MPIGTGADASMVELVGFFNSAVLKQLEKAVYDQVMKNAAVLYRFWRKGPKIDGGMAMVWPIIITEKRYGTWYFGAQELPHGQEDTMAPAELRWKWIAEDVTIAITDLKMASSPYAQLDIIKTKFDEAVMNLRQRITRGLFNRAYSYEGSEDKQIDGFMKAIDAGGSEITYNGIKVAGWSEYAGVSRSNTYWQSAVVDKNSGNVSLADIQNLYGMCSDGNETPTLGIVRQEGFNFLWGQVQALQRYVRDEEMAQIGFETIRFNNAVIIVDNWCPPGTLLFVNERWVDLVTLAGENFNIDPIIYGTPSQRVLTTKVTWAGNLRVKIPKMNGKIIRAANL
ncbi:MAG: phage major capsid protein [Thermoplasmatales archaeon]